MHELSSLQGLEERIRSVGEGHSKAYIAGAGHQIQMTLRVARKPGCRCRYRLAHHPPSPSTNSYDLLKTVSPASALKMAHFQVSAIHMSVTAVSILGMLVVAILTMLVMCAIAQMCFVNLL